MAKRITDRNLCDMNWNHDDDYPIASEGVLKNREIKKAVRRNAGGEGEGPRALRGFDGIPATTTSAGSGAAAPAFLGFGNGTMSSFSLSGLTHANSFTPLTGGFSSPNHTTPALALNDPAASKPTASFGAFYSPAVTANANLAPAWALGAAASKPTAADVTSKQTFDGSSLTRIASNSSISCSSTGSSIFNNSPSSSSILNSTSIPSSNTSNNIFNSTNTSSSSSITSSLNSANTSSVNEDYNRELAALNCSVRDWITKHVDVNPLLDLSPVFRDYERHLANVEHKYSGVEAEAAAAGAAAGSATVLEGLADSQASEEKQWALPPPTSTATSLSSSSSSDGTRLFSFGLKDHGRSSPDKSGASPPGSLLSCFGQQVDTSAAGSAGTHLPATVPTPLLPFSSGSPPDPHDKNKDIFSSGSPPDPHDKNMDMFSSGSPPDPHDKNQDIFSSGSPPDPHDKNKDIFSSGSPPDPHDKNKDIFSSGSPLFAFNKNRDTFSSSSIPFSYDKHATFGPSSSGPFGQAPMFRAPQAFSAESVALPLPSSCAGGVIGAETVQPTHDNGANTESDEPPKPEVTEVKETDAFYSKRCKLFYKKESEYKEKGVGTLHLKLTPGGKTQLIVRADTNLGNILLNIVLQASVPCSRVGKNNVLVVCVPNPSVDDKNPGSPLPLLIRVKTTEEADELHKLLEEKKVL